MASSGVPLTPRPDSLTHSIRSSSVSPAARKCGTARPFCVESALSGVMKRAERLWYRRTFEVPAAWAGKRTLLHFGAVDWEATVLVNGKALGAHKGGFDGFGADGLQSTFEVLAEAGHPHTGDNSVHLHRGTP